MARTQNSARPPKWTGAIVGAVNNPAEPPRRFLTLEQVAEELNVGVPLVRSLVKTGELRALQVGGRRVWLVGAADVEDYITKAYQATAERIAAGDIPEEATDE